MKHHEHPMIIRAVDFIEANLQGPIALKDVAKAANLSEFHFHRLFTALWGETPGEFVTRIRLEKAAWTLVREQDLSITQVLMKWGFSSSQVFSRSFKRHFGMTPGEFRRTQNPQVFLRPSNHPEQISIPNLPEVEIQHRAAIRVAFLLTGKGYTLEVLQKSWLRISTWAAAAGISPAAQRLGISYDDPVIGDAQAARYKACIEIPSGMVVPSGLGSMEVRGGPYGCLRTKCRAGEIQGHFSYLYGTWLPQSGLRPADCPPFELYHGVLNHDSQPLYDMSVCIPIDAF